MSGAHFKRWKLEPNWPGAYMTSALLIVFSIAATHWNILGTLNEFIPCLLFPELTN